MVCDILDVRCLIVNELIGSVTLTILIAALIYFIIASKLRFSFEKTIVTALPILLLVGAVTIGFGIIYALGAFAVGILLALGFSKLIGNR